MINTLISFPDEDRAMMELEPFGYAINVAPLDGETGGEIVYAWNQGTAMVGGASIILSYKGSTTPGPDGEPIPINVPTLAPGFWVSLLSAEPDEALWEQMSAKAMCNSFGQAGYGGPCPALDDGPHRYVFTLHALDVPTLNLYDGTRQALECSLHAHTLATAQLMGHYERRS